MCYVDIFQSTSPSQGSTRETLKIIIDRFVISIHEPFTGLDLVIKTLHPFCSSNFNPRALHRARPRWKPQNCWIYPYFNPRALHRARRCKGGGGGEISDFNPRALHRARPAAGVAIERGGVFQSTSPSQGSTIGRNGFISRKRDFNPRALHRARPDFDRRRDNGKPISIHEPFTGLDPAARVHFVIIGTFQSTSPSQGSTDIRSGRGRIKNKFQSTSPSQGSTDRRAASPGKVHDFNPRALHRARL